MENKINILQQYHFATVEFSVPNGVFHQRETFMNIERDIITRYLRPDNCASCSEKADNRTILVTLDGIKNVVLEASIQQGVPDEPLDTLSFDFCYRGSNGEGIIACSIIKKHSIGTDGGLHGSSIIKCLVL